MFPSTEVQQEQSNQKPMAEQFREIADFYRSNYDPKYKEIIKDIRTEAEKGGSTVTKYINACWYDGVCLRLMEEGFSLNMEDKIDKNANTAHKVDIAW